MTQCKNSAQNQNKTTTTSIALNHHETLRYGENPHQTAAVYTTKKAPLSLAQAKPLQGKPMSYNNYIDANAALDCIRMWPNTQPACVIIKHCTPCGMATANSLTEAYQKALASDPVSAFGSIVALNQPLDINTAQKLSPLFIEVLIAPQIEPEALELLKNKKNLRILLIDTTTQNNTKQLLSIDGGIIMQDADHHTIDKNELTTVSNQKPSSQQHEDLWFAWQVVRQVKSNAIVLAKNGQTLGIGSGQTSRIFSCRIAILKAKEFDFDLSGAVLASDAFFPFDDCVTLAAEHGIKAIIQPGGSKRDQDSIDAANHFGLAMLFTGRRHFKH
jgi:phosphoribosylaminoimidazolecarboxamide formyltransferase / IMP cyclohydrolase